MRTKKIEIENGVNNNAIAAVTPMLKKPCPEAKPVLLVGYTGYGINFLDYKAGSTFTLAWEYQVTETIKVPLPAENAEEEVNPRCELKEITRTRYDAVETGEEISLRSRAIWPLNSGAYYVNKAGEKFLLSRELYGARNFFWITGEAANKDNIACQKLYKEDAEYSVDWFGKRYRHAS